ncbi:MAG: ATP-binding cassette domain-containing protein [Treponema sp.]|uniref:ATP-binding cassette domain-containing protein n=1 Tax=Treponema sp. TaxID=166 RepID=UPI003FA2A8A3
MKIIGLLSNNLNNTTCEIVNDKSIGLMGLSGSGKSSFCQAIATESLKRLICLLPKSEARFLFSDKLTSNFSAQSIENLPLVFYLGKTEASQNPRSTVGTHTEIFSEIRRKFADTHSKTSEFFSFNNSINWCPDCKGRGSTAGIVCKSCNGIRYSDVINNFPLKYGSKKLSITDVNSFNSYELKTFANDLELTKKNINLLNNLINLGIGYLSLDRIVSTLSGGEFVRLLLAEFMSVCENSLIIIDEISIGLDRDTLRNVLKQISSLGTNNQIWVIDHSLDVLNVTQDKLCFGPGSGKYGGNLISSFERPIPVIPASNEMDCSEFYTFSNLSKRNIKISSLSIPKNRLTIVTGESGCGKSTLIQDCLIPQFEKKYKTANVVLIGQDKNQSITSKSTIATFLDIKKDLDKLNVHFSKKDLTDILSLASKNKDIQKKLSLLINMGLSYLSLDRKVQSLSTGEFQCVHLTSKITEKNNNQLFLIFDEPSKGLSQNILNAFMVTIRNILKTPSITILMIEHNSYLLNCADFVIDFGKRTEEDVTSLSLLKKTDWEKFKKSDPKFDFKLSSKITDFRCNIKCINKNIDEEFNRYENILKGGLLKNFSATARWIYRDYVSSIIKPVIVLDLEKQLYSDNTFLFETMGIINCIIEKSGTNDTENFDFYNRDNLCDCCKGRGIIESFDFNLVIENEHADFDHDFLNAEVMKQLKRYNMSKIKFLFKQLKSSVGLHLSKKYSEMTKEEQKVLFYGYWNESFYDSEHKTQRVWQGLKHLILKYMRYSKDELKAKINASKINIVCPICSGALLNHQIPLKIGGKDIRNIIVSEIDDAIFKDIPQITEIKKLLGNVKMNLDVSSLPVEQQVILKVLEIKYSSFYGYQMILKNYAPFKTAIEPIVNAIAKNNAIIILDYEGISQTKEQMLQRKFKNQKLSGESYVYEFFGYKKILPEINKIKKENPCPYCHGKGELVDESIFEGVDITKTPCRACNETGISASGLNEKIENISLDTWLYGTAADLPKSIPEKYKTLKLCQKIKNINKYFINEMLKE